VILPISASQVARITGVRQRCLALDFVVAVRCLLSSWSLLVGKIAICIEVSIYVNAVY
jgi:hypothetical protein